MGISQRQVQKLQQTLSPQQIQMIKLLELPAMQLEQRIKQESGSWKWALFAACYTTGLAWLVSFAVYQIGGLFV